jgi:hypothetical protein
MFIQEAPANRCAEHPTANSLSHHQPQRHGLSDSSIDIRQTEVDPWNHDSQGVAKTRLTKGHAPAASA